MQQVKIDSRSVIDLTHIIDQNIPTWNGSCGFQLRNILNYEQCEKGKEICLHEMSLSCGIGTHIDAPSHFFQYQSSVDQLSLSSLIGPAIHLDVSHLASSSFKLSARDIQAFELEYGKIPADTLIIINTGWSRLWNTPAQYRNADENGIMHFPSVSKEAAEYLLERNVLGIAIDTLSPDLPESDFPVHKLFLGNGKFIIENVAHPDLLPKKGALVAALPMNIEGASEAPIRLIAFLE